MTSARPLKVLLVGLGPIGQGIARVALRTEGLRVVGAADPAPHLAGRDLGSLLDLGQPLRLKVDGEPERLLARAQADVAIVSTGSTVREVKGVVSALLARRMDVVTTCEELSYPTRETQPAFAELDRLAQLKKVSLLATGVNPGFAMDWLALAYTGVCSRVERVSVTRVVDAATRRLPLQRKVGAGLSLAQFRRAVTEGAVRHVGLTASLAMIADGLGLALDRVEEVVEPTIAPRDLETPHLRIPAGSASGIRQHARGYRGGDVLVHLDLQIYVGATSPRDHLVVDGEPPLDVTVNGGIAGDEATAAIVVNAVPKVLAAAPGLRTMRDLPAVHRLNPAELRALAARK